MLSAIGQTRPAIIEIKGLQNSHFKESKTAPWDWLETFRWGMSNVLKVGLQTTICSLADRGWSQRPIVSELGINRETVGRYLQLAKPAFLYPGAEEGAAAKQAIP